MQSVVNQGEKFEICSMNYRLLILFLLVFITANSAFGQIKVVAHRGASRFAPENTLPSCEKAIEMGADYIEMDVRQTKDGVFILMHDASLKRTTNGTGKVAEVDYAYIQTLDAGSWFETGGDDFTGTRVPTLREALQAIKGRCLPDIDLKAGDPEALVELLREEGLLESGEVTLYSRDRLTLAKITGLTDQIQIRPSVLRDPGGISHLKKKLDPPIVNLNYRGFSVRKVKRIHKMGMKAFVNTLGKLYDRKPNMKTAIKAEADFIQTDYLEVLMPLLREKGLHE